jgi:uncharacterized protein YndB with AHSA1/START domain
MSDTDRIEKHTLLRAPRSKVWRALTDAEQFGTWFGAKLDAPFEVGKRVGGHITTPGYEHMSMDLLIERIEPESLFSFRWHPGEDAPQDGADEPLTLVEFRLEDAEGGTRLTVVESGFDALPPGRRERAFRSNEGGWTEQLKNIERHVAG